MLTTTMNYQELTTKLRELARDLLRIRWVNNTQDSILYIKNKIEDKEKIINFHEKTIKITEYKELKLDTDNPEYDDLMKLYKEAKECNLKLIEKTKKEIEELNEEINKNQEIINKINSGELKVNAESLSEKTKMLAEEYMKRKASEIQ